MNMIVFSKNASLKSNVHTYPPSIHISVPFVGKLWPTLKKETARQPLYPVVLPCDRLETGVIPKMFQGLQWHPFFCRPRKPRKSEPSQTHMEYGTGILTNFYPYVNNSPYNSIHGNLGKKCQA